MVSEYIFKLSFIELLDYGKKITIILANSEKKCNDYFK